MIGPDGDQTKQAEYHKMLVPHDILICGYSRLRRPADGNVPSVEQLSQLFANS